MAQNEKINEDAGLCSRSDAARKKAKSSLKASCAHTLRFVVLASVLGIQTRPTVIQVCNKMLRRRNLSQSTQPYLTPSISDHPAQDVSGTHSQLLLKRVLHPPFDGI
jgi:hypothetical protein